MMELKIGEESQEAIAKYAEECKPEEACGFVVEVDGAETVVSVENRSRHADRMFLIHPSDWTKTRKTGEIIAVWHSHTQGTAAKASQTDRHQCEAIDLPWYIYAVGRKEWDYIEPNGYVTPLRGRAFVDSVMDCYTLCRDYYKEELGLSLPEFFRQDSFWSVEEYNLYLDNYGKADFVQVPIETLRRHDAILFQWCAKVPHHAAVYVGDCKILHHLQHMLSCEVLFGEYWRARAHSVYRHKSQFKARDPYIDSDGELKRWPAA
jgi:proteasome lid subunit RPN8/RPN11